MVAAPERIRVNCDLRHVTVVLCCDPKAFTHCNPLDGMSEGGCLIWESDETGEEAWERLPLWARQQIVAKKIRVFTLPGFQIAREATDRSDLQLRMQGNAFLGAFFAVSPVLHEFGITKEQFHDVVHKQYEKKFGRLGEAVVASNMEVIRRASAGSGDTDRRFVGGRSLTMRNGALPVAVAAATAPAGADPTRSPPARRSARR
jgi:pyruvate-ferredoxin/flavodoxin oxidoreductase